MQHTHFLYSFLLLSLIGCATMPKDTHSRFDKIPTSAGPEDIYLDTISSDSARLLVSCSDHRLSAQNKGRSTPNGDIYQINLDRATPAAERMYRTNEPAGLDFHPHGIYLCADTTGLQHYLYVVSHNNAKNEHSIYQYEVSGDSLVFVRAYRDALIYAPNSVAALPQGGFYTANDKGRKGGLLELLLRQRHSDIIYCDADGKCAKVADKLAYANGVYIQDNHYLYLATTRQNRLFRYTIQYDGNLVDRQEIAKIVGGDNVRQDDAKNTYVAAHLRDLKFLGHLKKSTNISPSVIYKITPQGEKTVVYANKGEQISAGSTALPYKGYLYICQVFEPFIIRVKVSE